MSDRIFFSFICTLIFFFQSSQHNITKLLISLFFVNCLEEMAITHIKGSMKNENYIHNSSIINLSGNIIVLIILLITVGMFRLWGYYRQRFNTTKLKTLFFNLIMILLITATTMIAYIHFQFLDGSFTYSTFNTNSIALIAYAFVCIMGFFLIYLEIKKEEHKHRSEHDHQMFILQKHYYETLLNREARTKQFRHDMNNHLVCIQEMADRGNLPGIRDYVSNLISDFSTLQKRIFETGNDILNIITNYHISKLPDNINVSVTGTASITSDNYILCGIYSNLIQNAVQELHRCPAGSELKVNFDQKGSQLVINIINTISDDKSPKYSEDIKDEHGLGLKNVMNLVEKQNGKLDVHHDDKFFYVTASFNIN